MIPYMKTETCFMILKVMLIDTRLEWMDLTIWDRFNVIYVFYTPCITGNPEKFELMKRTLQSYYA